MLGEIFTELKEQARDRIRNPLFGPFIIAWFVGNWKLVSVLFGSSNTIEDRILFIQENYISLVYLLYVPLCFAVFYALILPWINLGIQHIQEGVNLRIKKHKLKIDTHFLQASVGRAEAQAALNLILAKDQITQKQKDEIEMLRRDLSEQQEYAQASIADKETALDARLKEYEERSNKDNAEAEKERIELERLRQQLLNEREKVKADTEKLRADLVARQEELDSRVGRELESSLASKNGKFKNILLSGKFRLFHNPGIGLERSKIITFGPEGKVIEGNNGNENTWRIADNKLELVQSNGAVHSRFYYFPESKIFVHTGDSDTRSARGQYIVPESD